MYYLGRFGRAVNGSILSQYSKYNNRLLSYRLETLLLTTESGRTQIEKQFKLFEDRNPDTCIKIHCQVGTA